MDTLHELKNWVQSLNKGEKRNVKLLGRSRAGGTPSLHLKLFDWLNTDALEKAQQPEPDILQQLPTASARLKSLILDSLRIQHQSADLDAQLAAGLDGARQLTKKKLFAPALRLLAKNKALAWKSSRYTQVLASIEQERAIARQHVGKDFWPQVKSLADEEARAMESLALLQRLLLHYDHLRSKTMALISPRETPLAALQPHDIPDATLAQLLQAGNYLERALAVNILGIHDLFHRNTLPAVQRYQQLLTEWRAHEDWQRDQGQLLYNIAIMYQIACLTSPLSLSETQAHLAFLPDFKAFEPDIAREFQSSLFLNQLVIGLNSGQLSWVESAIPSLNQWLHAQQDKLAPRLVLAFLHNFSIVAFLNGQHAAAYGYVRRIQQVPNPKVREDIREFALVFQALLQLELGEFTLAESLVRSGKRYFRYRGRDWEFEHTVFRLLERQLATGTPSLPASTLSTFDQTLEAISQKQAGAMTILGLTELRLWASAKRRNLPLRDVFLEAIHQNLQP